MGLRFRRTLSLARGLRLNFSRSGVSTSVGVRGAHVTLGHGNIRTTVGIPGSGLSYTSVSRVGTTRGNSGSVVELIIWVVRYLPLIALYAGFINVCYSTMAGWHPVLIALALLSLTGSFIVGLRRLAEFVSQDVAAYIGGVCYATVMLTYKLTQLPELDWIWTTVDIISCALIGAWSFSSCHAAFAPKPVAPSPQIAMDDSTLEERHIDAVAAPTEKEPYTEAIPSESIAMSEYQAMVADRLRECGWETQVVSAANAANAASIVIAEYREKKVVILCAPASTPLRDEEVCSIYERRCAARADYAAIVSTATYTSSHVRLALWTRVLLLQPDQLDLLEDLIFGAKALEPQTVYRVEAEQIP